MKKTLMAALLCFSAAAQSPQAQNADKIDRYLEGLKYDPRALLSVKENGATETIPVKTVNGNSVVICTSERKPLSDELKEVTILSPSSNAMFPGALVRANRNLAEGKPELITLPRGPIALSADLPNLNEKGQATVANPTKGSVQTAIQKIQEEWFKDPKNVQGARQTFLVKKAYSSEQIALALKVSAKWDGGASLKVDSATTHSSASSTCIALFRQVYYTVSYDPPGDPAAVFDPKVTLDQVQRVVNAQNPAAYVKSMDYGRIILVRMETASSEIESDLAAAFKYATGGPAPSGMRSDLKAKYEKIISNSTFTVLTLGGNASSATEVMGDPKKAQDSLFKLIQSSATFNKQNPAYPIAYTVNFLNDNSLATFNFSTDYTESKCTEYPAGYVKVKNSGAYVARFKVTWDETGKDGKSLVPKIWESGNVTAGYQSTVDLPGDARNIKIRGEENTGFSWREAMSRTETGPTNKCYRIYGTTLMPKWDNSCN